MSDDIFSTLRRCLELEQFHRPKEQLAVCMSPALKRRLETQYAVHPHSNPIAFYGIPVYEFDDLPMDQFLVTPKDYAEALFKYREIYGSLPGYHLKRGDDV